MLVLVYMDNMHGFAWFCKSGKDVKINIFDFPCWNKLKRKMIETWKDFGKEKVQSYVTYPKKGNKDRVFRLLVLPFFILLIYVSYSFCFICWTLCFLFTLSLSFFFPLNKWWEKIWPWIRCIYYADFCEFIVHVINLIHYKEYIYFVRFLPVKESSNFYVLGLWLFGFNF